MRKFLCVDTETYEEDIKQWGPGWHLGKGHLIGVSFADETGWSTYLPLAHPETTAAERNKNIAIAKELFEEDCLHLGHNSLYDTLYLCNELGFSIPKKWHDTQYTMALLDEYRGRFGGPGYSLDSIASDLIGRKKEKTLIEQYCEERGWKGDPRQHLWKMPASVVAPYAKIDAALLLPVYKVQEEHIRREQLESIYEVESGLVPILTSMNKRGLKVNEERRIALSERLTQEAARLKKELDKEIGACNFNSSAQLAKVMDAFHIEYEKTDKGNPSIKNDFLEMLAHQGYSFAHKLVQWRKVTKVKDTFVDGSFKDYQDKNGRIHSTLIPVAADEAGTVSGRFACKNPNQQQVPSKDGDNQQGDIPLGTLCRSIFVPENDSYWMASADYSQLEFRYILNAASAPNAAQVARRADSLEAYEGMPQSAARKIALEEQIRAKTVLQEMIDTFNTDRSTDFHSLVSKITGLERGEAKGVSFGIAFFLGRAKMMKKYGWSEEKADQVLGTYYDRIPFIKPSREQVVMVAEKRGYIKTVGGRRARLAPDMKVGPIRDRKTYRMYNRYPQGSGADTCKKAMVDADKAGVYNEYLLEMQIHDEILGELPKTKAGIEAFKEMHRCMENAYKLKVPLLAEPAIGDSWGTTEERRKDKATGKKESIEEFFARYEAQIRSE